ncbi:hypothetical protein V8E51_001322, partial [Hyaloscypha variabilis]
DRYHLSKSVDYNLLAQGVGYNDIRLLSKRYSAYYTYYNDYLDTPTYRFRD